eukprot:4637609-Heterocapsa_arctica.AAC.1
MASCATTLSHSQGRRAWYSEMRTWLWPWSRVFKGRMFSTRPTILHGCNVAAVPSGDGSTCPRSDNFRTRLGS